MENLFIAITLILSSLLPIPTTNAIGQSPKEVDNWFAKLNQSKQKLTKLHFYYHNSRNPEKNLSAVQVAKSPPVFSENPPYFGVLTITDDPLTVGPDISSKIVGYGQGFYATSSLEEVSMLMGVTFVFTDGEFNGSTLAILGRNRIGDTYRELPIVGGSGVFRLATGVVTLQTYFFNFTMAVAIVEMDVVVLLLVCGFSFFFFVCFVIYMYGCKYASNNCMIIYAFLWCGSSVSLCEEFKHGNVLNYTYMIVAK